MAQYILRIDVTVSADTVNQALNLGSDLTEKMLRDVRVSEYCLQGVWKDSWHPLAE